MARLCRSKQAGRIVLIVGVCSQTGGAQQTSRRSDSANYSTQNLHRQKSLIFTYIFQTFGRIQRFGAGEGNRTLVTCLGSKSSTIELHPHSATAVRPPLPPSALRVNPLLAARRQRAVSQIVSIATKVDVLATCGKLEIFSPSTMR